MEISQTQKRIEMIEGLQRQIREAKEMLKEELENNAEFREVVEQANEINSKKKRLKDEISNAGSNKELLAKIREDSEEIATLKEILSAELMEVYTEQKVDEIPDANGEVRKFTVQAKLVSKRSAHDSRDGMGQYMGDEK